MITLCMETSHRFLVLGVMDEEKVLNRMQMEFPKKQSEQIFPMLEKLLGEVGLKPTDIDQVVITRGPGSYTGVRIAMSIAKVLCTRADLPLYTLDTLQLFAGKERCQVALDARSKRAYFGTFENGKCVDEVVAAEIELLKDKLDGRKLIGDASLFGAEDCYPDLVQNFFDLKDCWERVANVHTLVPEYLKDASAYMVKK